MAKTTTALHLLPTDDLRHRLDHELGGLDVELKNRGLDWLIRDLDGETIVANFYPAQGLLNVHAGGAAKPTFQGTGVSPDDIPGLLRRHLGIETDAAELDDPVDHPPIESELSERQRDLVFRLVVAMAGNPKHYGDEPGELVQRARDIAVAACHIKTQDPPA